MELDAHLVIAEGLDAPLEIEAPAVDGEALLLQGIGDVARGDRAVEGVGLADALGDLQPEVGHPVGDLLGGVALLGVAGGDLWPLGVGELDVWVGRLPRPPPGGPEGAAEAPLDLPPPPPPGPAARSA